MNALQVIEDNSDKLRNLGVKRAGIFGSFARGDERQDSDVDVYIVMEDEKRTLRNFSAIYDLLESNFHRKVDLVTDRSLKERAAKIILPTVKYASFKY